MSLGGFLSASDDSLVPAGWDPVLAGDQVMERLVRVSAPQVKGAHDSEFVCVGDKAYIVEHANDLKPGHGAGKAMYCVLTIVDLTTLEVGEPHLLARSGQQYENVTLPEGQTFVPRIIQMNETILRCYFASKGPDIETTWYRDFDIETESFSPGIHKAKLKTRAGVFDMQPDHFHADAVLDGFERPLVKSGMYIFDSFKQFDGKTYVALNNFPGKQNALAILHDDFKTFEVVGHYNEPQSDALSESAVNRLPDGTWMAIMRDDSGNKNYHFATSPDGRSWSEAVEMPFVPNGLNSKPTFDRFGDLYYLGWQENTRVGGCHRSVFNLDVSRDGKTWERKYRFETDESFQYPTFHEHRGAIWLSVSQSDHKGSTDRIMFGKLETLARPADSLPQAAAPDAGIEEREKPNVIVVLTDDQGYGDLACHGHPVLETPHLDRLFHDSIRLTDFHVAPMCTPTRGQLLTGLDAVRNRATAVSLGRQLPRRDLPTLADVFRAGGYATGLFGKWHLGHAWPYRPQDRGFEESMTFHGWGMAGIAELLNDYTNGAYVHRGERKPFEGYATDFWFDQAMRWMKQRRAAGERFFCYLATHTPHRPMWIEKEAFERFENTPVEENHGAAGFLAMIENIDDNMGRLEEFLHREKLHRDTVLVFLTDNGTAHGARVFNAGMRGKKTSLYDGGHRVPCFLRWPAAGLHRGRDLDGPTQVQDLLPTLARFAGLEAHLPPDLDGIDLGPALRDEARLPDRKLVVQYGDPERGDAAVLWGPWRLVRGDELYHVGRDPGQRNVVIGQHPEIARAMRSHYDSWWEEASPGWETHEPFVLAPSRENPVVLYGDNMAGGGGAGTVVVLDPRPRENGVWHLEVEEPGRYRVRAARWPFESGLPLTAPLEGYLHTGGYRPWPDDWHLILNAIPKAAAEDLRELPPAGKALPIRTTRLHIGERTFARKTGPGDRAAVFELDLAAGRHEMRCWFEDEAGNRIAPAAYVEFAKP